MTTVEPNYLTDEEVTDRYRGLVSVDTLCRWRAARIGPAYIKAGKSVLYPTAALDAWDKANTIQLRSAEVKRI